MYIYTHKIEKKRGKGRGMGVGSDGALKQRESCTIVYRWMWDIRH